ncbi:FadR family transcriptional regulator [Phytoactinopolyspora alkaliphila]|uniref:FadR family transcriptional regulator n=1 Tax=Phytoactinopolyspora alkaliphila TaxID=1783498 RepID=A0A6N9YTL2_9ACTN|nr:FadR/GntR family transcriptional regulator [Phytoactinopolyspora alkaliphila]NED98305.1 FadR family transcriptional regulator [Phytoactinopolyspora alkaliphila]
MRVPLYQQAQQALRQYVLDHGLEPGDPLPSEGELAEQLGMSRASVREATRSLESFGVIEARHGTGLFVGKFTFGPILEHLPYSLMLDGAAFEEVLEVRHALEEHLIVKISKVLTEQDLADLEEIVEQMRVQQVDGQPPPELDLAFHRRLFSPLGNHLVLDLIDLFWQLYNRIGEHLPEKNPHAVEIHAEIAAALRSRDPQRLVEAVNQHFAGIEHSVEAIHIDDD